MNANQAKEILTAALRKGQEKGVYTFEDVSLILPALNKLAELEEPSVDDVIPTEEVEN
jgi:hypothetical protein